MSAPAKRPRKEELEDSFDMPFNMSVVESPQRAPAANAEPNVPLANSLQAGGNTATESPNEMAAQFHSLLRCVNEINEKVEILEVVIRNKQSGRLPRFFSGTFSQKVDIKEPSRGAIIMLTTQYRNKERTLEGLIKECVELSIDHVQAIAHVGNTIMTPELSQIPPAVPKPPPPLKPPQAPLPHAATMRPPSIPSQMSHNRPLSNVVASNNVHSVKQLPNPIRSQQSTSTANALPHAGSFSVNTAPPSRQSSTTVANPKPNISVQQSQQQSHYSNAGKSVLNMPKGDSDPQKKYERGEAIMVKYQFSNLTRDYDRLKTQSVSQCTRIRELEDLRKKDAEMFKKQIEELKQKHLADSFRMNASIMNTTVQEPTVSASSDTVRMPPPARPVLQTKPVQLNVPRFRGSSFRDSHHRNTNTEQLFHHDSGLNPTFIAASSQVLGHTDFSGNTQSVKPLTAGIAPSRKQLVAGKSICQKDAQTQVENDIWTLETDKEDFVDDLLALTMNLPRERFDLQKMEFMATPTSDLVIQRCRPKPDPEPVPEAHRRR